MYAQFLITKYGVIGKINVALGGLRHYVFLNERQGGFKELASFLLMHLLG